MFLRQIAYRVSLKSGLLTREVLTHASYKEGELVKDSRGRIFRVRSCDEAEYNGVSLTKLYGKEWIS